MSGKGFRVDPEKLEAVATRVKNLLEAVDGTNGRVPGRQSELQDASYSELSSAISSLLSYEGGGMDPFTKGYQFEQIGMTKLYDNMVGQLKFLYETCHGTAKTYKDHEDGSKKSVNASDGAGSGNGRI